MTRFGVNSVLNAAGRGIHPMINSVLRAATSLVVVTFWLAMPVMAQDATTTGSVAPPVADSRVYPAQPWEFGLNDVNFVQAVAQVVGMALELCRINKGYKDSIDILKTMRDPKTLKFKRRTPFEGVPQSFSTKEMAHAST